jgi:hypothetical protein
MVEDSAGKIPATGAFCLIAWLNASKISHNGYNSSVIYGAMPLQCPDHPLAGASEVSRARGTDR